EALAEQVARAGADALDGGAALLAEVHGVEVCLEDLVLRVAKLEDERDGDLACLAPPRPLSAQKQPPCQLLCDRAGPTDDGGLTGVGEGGPGDRQQIDTVVTHEP